MDYMYLLLYQSTLYSAILAVDLMNDENTGARAQLFMSQELGQGSDHQRGL